VSPAAAARPRAALGRRLLAGPAMTAGAERMSEHVRRLGPRPRGGAGLLEVVKASGLRGRGGAWFPTWKKWSAVRERSDGHAVIVVNASEGEPLSAKDRVLLETRPHLVLDGAALAAETVGADDIVVYLSRGSRTTDSAISRAVEERGADPGPALRIERTSHRYIAGESSAAINRLSGGPSKPTFRLHRSADKGVGEHPTLVQNAETLAHVALVARYGSDWFRMLGPAGSPGSTLLTLCGNVARPGVYEVDTAATLGDVLNGAGGTVSAPGGALIGGYFGTWLAPQALAGLPLDVDVLRSHGIALGCGVVAVLPRDGCAIVEATRVLAYLAAETSGQCGPCVNGLAALAETMQRIAASAPEPEDGERVWRWIDMVDGRGACHHPDGAVGQLRTALGAFRAHFDSHLAGRPCVGAAASGFPPPPRPGNRWK
jgi:NADH:ubiquinone oxidoreductase subunit F (NADH-binding)